MRSALVEEVQNFGCGVFDLGLDCLVTSAKSESRALCPSRGSGTAKLIARERPRYAASTLGSRSP
jgi:hypothetical protein